MSFSLKNIYTTFRNIIVGKKQKRTFRNNSINSRFDFNKNNSYNIFPFMIEFSPKDFNPSYREIKNPTPNHIDVKDYLKNYSHTKEYFEQMREYMNINHIKDMLDMYTKHAKKIYNEWKPRMNNLESITVSKIKNGVSISFNKH